MKVKVVKWCRKKWNEHNMMYIYHKQCEIKQKKSLKQLKRPNSLISHWFPVEMVQTGPKLCKCKRIFLKLKIMSEVSRVYQMKADVLSFPKSELSWVKFSQKKWLSGLVQKKTWLQFRVLGRHMNRTHVSLGNFEVLFLSKAPWSSSLTSSK